MSIVIVDDDDKMPSTWRGKWETDYHPRCTECGWEGPWSCLARVAVQRGAEHVCP